MQSVSQAFLDTMAQPDVQVKRQVSYKRRYWNGSAYVWESNWTALTEDKVVSVSAITTQLDTQSQNEFKESNLTVVLDNHKNQWMPGNDVGLFAKDSGSPTYGYEPYWTKFRVQCGLVKSDGTTELVTVFTGVSVDFIFNSQDGSAQVMVAGEQALVIGSNAEAVSTLVTNETMTGVANGSNKDFTTSHNGVGIIRSVTDNGVVMNPGIDFTLSQINDPTHPGKVTFTTAPASGHTIAATYLYWKTSQTIESLIASLATQAGISPGNQSIVPVVFPNTIINTHYWSTQPDFAAGAYTGGAQWDAGLATVDIGTIGNSFTIGNTLYTINLTPVGPATKVAQGFSLPYAVTITAMSIYPFKTDWPNTYTITYTIELWSGTAAGPTAMLWSSPSKTTKGSTWTYPGFVYPNYNCAANTVYYIVLNDHTDGIDYINYGKSPGYGSIVSYYYSAIPAPSWYAINDGSGNPPYINSLFQVVMQAQTGVWTSQALPTTGALGYLPLNINADLGFGTLTVSTRTSHDGSTWSSWAPVSVGNVPVSPPNDYTQLQVSMALNGYTQVSPHLNSLSLAWSTSTLTITLASFNNLTCYDAIQALAQMCNYEFGFDENEVFFFRPKSSSAPALTLSRRTNVLAILSTALGYDRLVTTVRAAYGGYVAEKNDPGGYQSPSARIGFSLYDASQTTFLISPDANLAVGAVQQLFNFYSKPRRRVKVSCKFLPQLQLSDVVTLTYDDNTPVPAWYWGDPDAYWGRPDIYYYGGAEQLYYQLPAKVVGIRLDTDNWTSELDLEEVV